MLALPCWMNLISMLVPDTQLNPLLGTSKKLS